VILREIMERRMRGAEQKGEASVLGQVEEEPERSKAQESKRLRFRDKNLEQKGSTAS
jgi:hypothetical protein